MKISTSPKILSFIQQKRPDIRVTTQNNAYLIMGIEESEFINFLEANHLVFERQDTLIIIKEQEKVVTNPTPQNVVKIKNETSEQPPAMPVPVDNLYNALFGFQTQLLAQARLELQSGLDATKQAMSQQIAELQNMVTIAKQDMATLSVDLKKNIGQNKQEIDTLLINTRQTIEAKIANINELAIAAQKEIAQAKADSIANISEQTQHLQIQINAIYEKLQTQDQENTKSHIAFVAFIDTLKKAWSDLMMTLDGNACPVSKPISSQKK